MNRVTCAILLILLPLAHVAFPAENDGSLARYVQVENVLADAMPSVITVRPSGDKTGRKDLTNIQEAVDSLQASVVGGFGVVQLSGRYFLNGTITCGMVGNGSDGINSKVVINGLGVAEIICVGSERNGYAIRMFGGASVPKPVLRNLRVVCGVLCRGVLLSQTASQSSVENVAVEYSRQSAFDLIDCWCTNFRNVTIKYAWGYALRGHRTHECHFDSLQILSCRAFSSKDQSILTDNDLYSYAMENGGAQFAKEKYGQIVWDDIWPSPTDTECVDFDGTPVTSSERTRSAIQMYGEGSVFTNLAFEQCAYVEYPLMYLTGSKLCFDSMRLEYNKTLREKVFIYGGGNTSGTFNVFNFVCIEDGSPFVVSAGPPVVMDYRRPLARQACECFLRLTGNTVGNKVNRLIGNSSLTRAIILLDGGSHAGTICTECATSCGHIPRSRWIKTVNSPMVFPEWSDVYFDN